MKLDKNTLLVSTAALTLLVNAQTANADEVVLPSDEGLPIVSTTVTEIDQILDETVQEVPVSPSTSVESTPVETPVTENNVDSASDDNPTSVQTGGSPLIISDEALPTAPSSNEVDTGNSGEEPVTTTPETTSSDKSEETTEEPTRVVVESESKTEDTTTGSNRSTTSSKNAKVGSNVSPIGRPGVEQSQLTGQSVKDNEAQINPSDYINTFVALETGQSQVGAYSEVTQQVVSPVSFEQPVVTATGYTIVDTVDSKVVVLDTSGKTKVVEPESIGAVVNSDMTISVKKETGEMVTLPKAGDSQSIFAIVSGFTLMAIGIQSKRTKEDYI